MRVTHTTSTRNGSPRFHELDVARSIALFGIIVMNYHGYLNGADAAGSLQSNWFLRLMDPWNGVLAPSPVIFVLVAGISCGILTLPSIYSADKINISTMRWVLIRRGLFLFISGSIFEWVWRGTILPYYGVYFLLAALLFTWRIRHVALAASVCILIAAVLAIWQFVREDAGHSTAWLRPYEPNSPRNLLFRTFIDYTHPVFPWFAFFCVGLIIGKSYLHFRSLRPRIVGIGAALLVVVYGVSALVQRSNDGILQVMFSTDPFQRGVLATVGTCTSAVVVVALISLGVERIPESPLVDLLQRAGQVTLTLYVLHGLIYNASVDWWGWVSTTGFMPALIFSAVVWIILISFGAWWQRFIGRGPLEIIYRKFGG